MSTQTKHTGSSKSLSIPIGNSFEQQTFTLQQIKDCLTDIMITHQVYDLAFNEKTMEFVTATYMLASHQVNQLLTNNTIN